MRVLDWFDQRMKSLRLRSAPCLRPMDVAEDPDDGPLPLVTQRVLLFTMDAQNCALSMSDNAAYVLKELPRVGLDHFTHEYAVACCLEFVDTQQKIRDDLISYLERERDYSVSEERLRETSQRIFGRIREATRKMHLLVKDLEERSGRNPVEYGLAYLLVAESATNVLNSFNELQHTTEVLLNSFALDLPEYPVE